MYKLDDSVLDPLLAYEKYVSKLYPENSSLFQKPKKNYIFEQDIWYTKEVLGKNTLSGIMKSLSQSLSFLHKSLCESVDSDNTLSRWH